MLIAVILKAINSQKTRDLEVSVSRVRGLRSTKTEEFAFKSLLEYVLNALLKLLPWLLGVQMVGGCCARFAVRGYGRELQWVLRRVLLESISLIRSSSIATKCI